MSMNSAWYRNLLTPKVEAAISLPIADKHRRRSCHRCRFVGEALPNIVGILARKQGVRVHHTQGFERGTDRNAT
jgi:hypothetical protein